MVGESRGLITVVIPAYNNPVYLDKSVKSVLQQSYRPLEILVIDDASSPSLKDVVDVNRETINRLGLSDVTLKFIRNDTNQGFYRNSIKGLEEAGGRYGCFLHHDDEMLEHYFLDESITVIENNANTFVAVSNAIVEGTLHTLMAWNYPGWVVLNGDRYVRNHMYADAHPSFSSIVFNLEKLRDIGYFNCLVEAKDGIPADVELDEGLLFLVMLASIGTVAVSGKVMSQRGSPITSFSRSAAWRDRGLKYGGLAVFLVARLKCHESIRKNICFVIKSCYLNSFFYPAWVYVALMKSSGAKDFYFSLLVKGPIRSMRRSVHNILSR